MELEPMIELKSKIETLAKKSTEATNPADAMHLTQAALNLAQAFATLKSVKE
jgi:hypothetical protein|tara:strand:+ start:340 stop:495 length:156 start_codon:yes stop_codon:yes gene_type:complete